MSLFLSEFEFFSCFILQMKTRTKIIQEIETRRFLWCKTLLALWRFGNRSYHFQTANSLLLLLWRRCWYYCCRFWCWFNEEILLKLSKQSTSEHHRSRSWKYKVGLIKCLLDRIWKICSTEKDKAAEIEQLKRILEQNEFP